MGYLNKATITVDAILTNRGRELLADGGDDFTVTKFAVSDDEIDYRLYRTDHPQGSARYGAIIENMPMLEATTDETQTMRYKLITIEGVVAGGTPVIPQISGLSYSSGLTLNLTAGNNKKIEELITPKTTYDTPTATAEANYVLVVADSSILSVDRVSPNPSVDLKPNARGSITATGTSFKIKSRALGKTTVTVYGETSGATYSFIVTVTS